MWQQLQKALDQREARQLSRNFQSPNGGVDFCSNDYLGLAGESIALPSLPGGNAASRLISGYSAALQSLEKELAHYYEAEQVVLFNSGYEANSGLFGMLASLGVRVIYDEHIHASIRHALHAAKKSAWSFRHNDLNDLEAKLIKADGDPVAVVTESLFSMGGDRGALAEISQLKLKYDFTFIVDEAHGTGVLGGFTGLTGSLNLINAVDVRIHTFGKAIGAQGACIAGSELLQNALTQFCQPLIYSTAPAPIFIEFVRESHRRYVLMASGRQAELNRNIECFLRCVEGHGRFSHNYSPIQWYAQPGNEAVLQLASRLRTAGFDTIAIRTPTVAEGSERVRICLHAFNSEKDIEALVAELSRNV